ncbi:MAG: sulfatase-like hydrolase/transferase [Chthoniobacterales bacterium]
MKKILILSIVACATHLLGAAETEKATRPNILFIITDDQGYGDWSTNGHPLLKTPNVDKLAAESVRLENFYVSASCSPTRAALLTGMHEFRSGITHTQWHRVDLPQDTTTLPELLAPAGYRTGLIGKWHLGKPPAKHGFQWCSTNPGGPFEHFDPVMVRNGQKTKETGYREDIFFNDAMNFITETKDQPWFLWLSTYSPHDPLAAPEEFVAPFRGKVTEEQAQYLGMVANLDYNIGRLLVFLKENNLDENTVVVLMSDNGQTYGLDVYNANMRGCKATVWEGGLRTFSYWRWTGHWPPHQVDNLSAHIDVLPTLCAVAGAKIPADLQPQIEGFNLLPVLEAKGPIAWHDDRFLYHHVARWPGGMAADHKYAMAGARQGNYLLVRSRSCDNPDCEDANGQQCETLRSVEQGSKRANYTAADAQFHWGVTPRDHWALFDVKKDPGCLNDLAAAEPGRAAAMAEAYDAWWDQTYPVMVERGGDAEIVWSKVQLDLIAKKKAAKAEKQKKSE